MIIKIKKQAEGRSQLPVLLILLKISVGYQNPFLETHPNQNLVL